MPRRDSFEPVDLSSQACHQAFTVSFRQAAQKNDIVLGGINHEERSDKAA